MSDDVSGADRPASPRRRQEAREAGQVVRSRELVFAVMYAAVGGMVAWTGPGVWRIAQLHLREGIRAASAPHRDVGELSEVVQRGLLQFASAVTPILAVLCLAVVGGHWTQHGPLWLPEKCLPDASRINPAVGWQRLGRGGSLVRLAIWMVKSVLLLGIGILVLRDQQSALQNLMYQPLDQMVRSGGQLVIRLASWLGLGIVVSAALDYAWQVWRHETWLRMTPAERREEVKAVRNDVLSHQRRKSRA